jgi:hypothetical protein
MQMIVTAARLGQVHIALSMMLVLTLALPWPAFADSTSASAEGAASVTGATTLSFGSVCPNPTVGVVNCDISPPVLMLPGSIVVEAENSSGATVRFTVTATDANPVVPTVSCTPASGSTFPLGVTVVTCSATGASGITSYASFTVRVQDTRPPSISKPADITEEATGPTGAQVAYTSPTASDVAGPTNPTVACIPGSGSTFPIGTTVVNCSATDAAGHTVSATFNVTIVETPPSSTLPADQPVQLNETSRARDIPLTRL